MSAVAVEHPHRVDLIRSIHCLLPLNCCAGFASCVVCAATYRSRLQRSDCTVWQPRALPWVGIGRAVGAWMLRLFRSGPRVDRAGNCNNSDPTLVVDADEKQVPCGNGRQKNKSDDTRKAKAMTK